ncbi:spindle pole body component 110-like [Mizuhopecten yessoensis]|uniref:spindle pole body component 110-like n=1 Tax=Mizuhopecten yessoensis TaxID=6573 RepID=UPI000B457E62|nr:spindle pole body component 110-like [Mizuhopecten yessoensis]XP_021374427.1 spindle pole body component 110-like [Mizuhopecten yessoensis]XP_021374428.1 spindle pole body component 110-like [Mizuhopecten yessoensis]XP_021374429.1 spindle pole body component 110-like [Mizuhopecten yessoensis]XP_021374430.1 spindle pole body component 110-like [Mizuhopecten yessoensis]
MEQSVVVSSSHIVRQGTFDTDSSKTLRSKSGAIKKGSIFLPVIDDKSVGLSHVEYKGDSVELVKKRKKASEKPPVKTDDSNQSESKKDKVSPRGTIGKSKDREQTNQENGHQSSNETDANTEQKPIQLKASSNKSSKQHHPVKSEVVKSDVTETQEGQKFVKSSNAYVKDGDKGIVNKKVQDNVTAKNNSRIKEPAQRTSEQDSQSSSLKNETVSQDKTRTSRNNVSLEKNTSNTVEKNTSVRKSKTNRNVTTSPNTDQSDIRIIGHIEAPSLSGSPQSTGHQATALTNSENNVTSDVKSTKRETKDPKRSSNKQSKDLSKRPTTKTVHVDDYDSEKSTDISNINVNNREKEPVVQESDDNFNKTQKGAPLKKRFSRASDLREDTSMTHVRNVASPNLHQRKTVNNISPERISRNNEHNGTNNNKVQESKPPDNESYTHNLDPLVASIGVVNKPPQSTALTRHEDDKSDSYTHKSQGNPVEPVTQKTKDLKSSSKMEPGRKQEFGSERVMESYDSVYAERKTLLEAEVTYKKRITQLENEMNQFVKTVDGLRTENKTIRTTMDQLEVDNRKKESHQSQNTVVIDVEKDDLKRQINLLKKENKSLDDKLNTSYERNDELKAANQTLDDENILLRNRIQDSERKSSGRKREKSIVGSNAGSSKDVKENLERSDTELSKAKLTEFSLRAEISALKKAEERYKKESEKLRSDKKKLEYELEKYKDAAKEDAEFAKDGATTARDKMELKSHVVSLQTDNQNLNEENMKLKAECLEQVRKIHELEKAEKTEVEGLKNENEKLKSEKKKLQEENNGGSGGNTKKLEAENKALSEALSQKKIELDELMHALNGDRIEDEVQKVKAEKEELQKKFEESQKNVEISEKAMKELEEIKLEKASLKQKLEVSEKKVEESDRRDEQIVELKSEKEKLQKQLDENEKRVLESADSMVMVHELKSDKEKLQKELHESKTRESKVQESLMEVKIQKDALETEKKQIKEELVETVKTNQNIKTEMQGLKSSQETMSRALDEEKSKITLLAEKEYELDELRKKCELLEKELSRTKQLHSLEMDKINDERKKEENKLRKELENLTERKNEIIEKLTKKMLSMESSKDLEIKKLKEQIEALLVDQEIVEKTKATEKENKEFKLELKTLYNKYSQVVNDLEQKNTTEERAFEMSMRVEKMSVKMKLMEKDEREWRVKRERFDEIEASNKRLIEESVVLKKMLEGKGNGSDDMSHRINYLERRQTDADTRVKQLEGWVGDLYVETERSDKGSNKNATKNKKAKNSKTMQIQNPSNLSTQNVKARSLDDVEVNVDDKATESSTPTLPSIYANSTGQLTYRSVGYSQIHKARLQKATKKRR